jgi:tRNA A-37 threonylcarbamoyl transferase component Bud32
METGGGSLAGQLGEGQVLGDYEILAVAGTGGMGVVYKARQQSLDRVVALKVIREEIARTPEYRDRFLREARLAASVDHPNVVSVYDVGTADEQLFLSMQWIEGEDLKHVIARSGRLAPERAVTIAQQLAGALDALHSTAGLVHRDVKPANALLRQMDGKDHAYLTDFGVAKPSDAVDHLTQTGWVVGTTGYLSPEQIMGQQPSPSSDLYALGCLFFEALTGQPPFHADNEMALRWAHANNPRPQASAVLPALGQRYDDFLSVALAVDPAHRFATGRAFANALTATHNGQQDLADAPTAIPMHEPTAVGPPTPLPPPQTPPPGMPPYSAYGYVTPTPPYPQQQRSGNPLALILLGIVALAGIAVGALAAAGVFSSGGSDAKTITSVTSQPRTTPTSSVPTHSSQSPNLPSGRSSCGGDLSVGPNTTCGFAANVETAYDQSSGGDTYVSATSPATGLTYSMHCTGGSPHVCTGGNNASVYFTSGPTPTPTPTPTPPSGNLSACDQNISAGPGTTCPFAENVFRSYASDYQANGQQSSNTITATSPVTNRTYSMSCTNDGVTVNCSGGNNAFVTFPFHAVQVY